jgi:hypothetical protein
MTHMSKLADVDYQALYETAHSIPSLHKVREIVMWGWSENSSCQGPEHAHIDIVKSVAHLTNNKDVFLWILRYHCRSGLLQQYKQLLALCLQCYWLSLHIAGPSQCTRVDKLEPHHASVPGTRSAVAGRSRKEIAQAVGNGYGVADWNYRQFSQDTFNRNDVENRFLVV